MNIASPLPMSQAVDPITAVAVEVALFKKDSALARPLGISHILGTMREILPGIFTWGSTYADRPWDLNGYAIRLEGCTVLVDPPAPGEDDWPSFDLIKPIAKIVLTNRDHVRDAELFRTRCAARLVAGADEVPQLAPISIDEAVREGDLIAGALRVIHLPGKSAGEIGLYFDQRTMPFHARWAASCSWATRSSATRRAR